MAGELDGGMRRRPASMPAPGVAAAPARKRGSYYQDVEEALSSLLWQPYEYRTPSDASASSDSLSTRSMCSSSGGGGGGVGGGMQHSFTDEFVVATARSSVNGNRADPHPGGVQLVSNPGQCGRSARSRGLPRSQPPPQAAASCTSASTSDGTVVPVSDSGVMRVEIPGPAQRDSDLLPPSLAAANVVGLPVHVRSASSTATPAAPAPVHLRSVSSPAPDPRVPPLPNVSNVNVNFYRAVPVTVVSNVPTIQCVNAAPDPPGNNVSNVHIVQAMPQAQPQAQPQVSVSTTVHPVSVSHPVPATANSSATASVPVRTFTSTEAQTDEPTVAAPREQRRRERRERRHQRRVNSHPHQSPAPAPSQGAPNERLPDLLNSHLPPPYTAPLPLPPPPPQLVPFPPGVVPVPVPVQVAPPPGPGPQPHSGFRFPFPTAAGFRRCRSRLGPRYSTEEHQPKSCCGFLVSRPGSLRWFIALIALVAVCCVLVGTVLGAMRPAGRDHLTVSLLMIGVGIVLVTVSGVAWRLTSHDAPSCRAMLGLEPTDPAEVCARRFVPRLPPSYGRPHHPYAAMIYPEFQYRPPPPSYQASMQEYRLRLLLLDRGGGGGSAGGGTAPVHQAQHAVSPPPTYRSHAGSLLRAPLSNRRDATQSEYSCPPSYRSRSSSNRPAHPDTVVHSREQSLSLSESNHGGSVVNVVSILTNQHEEIALETMALDSLKVAPDGDIPPLRMLLKSSSGSDLETSKDGNLVTIVQKADQNPVIVTVSGSQMSTTNAEVGSSNQIPSEMEILAHL